MTPKSKVVCLEAHIGTLRSDNESVSESVLVEQRLVSSLIFLPESCLV